MKYEIVNKYGDAYVLMQPVCRAPFESREFIKLLRESAKFLFEEGKISKRAHLEARIAVNLFERFLSQSNLEKLSIDEGLFESFSKVLQANALVKTNNKPYTDREVWKNVDYLRRILNDHFYPNKLILRKILPRKAYYKYQRFLSLSEATQRLIAKFEEDGRGIRAKKKYFSNNGREQFKYQVDRKALRLSGYNRKSRISVAFTILNKLNKLAIEDIEKSDFEDLLDGYHKEGKGEAGIKLLNEFFSVVANGIALGILKKNPYDDFLLEKSKRNIKYDFIMPDQMKKIQDLSTVDWDDPLNVRERCLTMFTYDTGLRVSTVPKLLVSDLGKGTNGKLSVSNLNVVNVKGSYLKGNKEDMQNYILFDNITPVLLKHWIEVSRPKLKPKTDHLFVSKFGKPLTSTGTRDIVYDCCRNLNIRSFKGNLPSPHILRHTLATLNIKPYGSLDSRLMQKRLGHNDLRTLENIYIHHNPLAEMKEYEKIRNENKKKHPLDKVAKNDFFQLLDSLALAEETSIRDIKRAYQHEVEKRNGQNNDGEWKESLSEDQTMVALASFQLEYRSFRIWALAQDEFCKAIKRNNGQNRYFYNKRHINKLMENYIGIDAALKKSQLSRRQFYRKLQKCKTIKIGRQTIILIRDFLRFMVGHEYA